MQRRAEHRLSRVHENTNFLAFMVCFWSVAEVRRTRLHGWRGLPSHPAPAPTLLGPPPFVSSRAEWTINVFSAVIYATRLIRERARAMYGEEMVPLPLPSTPAPDPVERFISERVRPMFGEKMVPLPLPLPTTPPLPVKLVPAWTLGRIPELEFEAGDSKPAGPLSI
ncbi:hypothetical protein B0H14DRAFT_3454265 [Mycena olivaceomarginata]|nr:hypothetical protein B0H14DRAFT_3454265 [Mycena olivaceomarginata]